MTDRTKGDHWGHLASELGAEIREDAAPVQSEPTGPGIAPGENQAAACASPAKRAEVETPRRPRPAANWNAIASSLGLETPPEVLPAAQAIVKPAECPAEVHKPSAEVGPELGDLDEPAAQPRVSTAQLAETVASLPESVKAAPAGIGHEPTMLIGHEAPAAGAGFGMGILEEKPASDDGGEPARGKSRRRRRRKPRSGERQPASGDSGQVSGSDVDSEIESCDEPCGQSELESVVEGESLGSESASESDSEEKRRSKRRRSRRRRPKGDTTDVKTSPESDSEADASGDEDDMDDMDADDMADVMDGDGHSDKSGHRSIPVWQDAISIVIEKNLESRAKKPDGGGQQKRGGRRSGRRGRG